MTWNEALTNHACTGLANHAHITSVEWGFDSKTNKSVHSSPEIGVHTLFTSPQLSTLSFPEPLPPSSPFRFPLTYTQLSPTITSLSVHLHHSDARRLLQQCTHVEKLSLDVGDCPGVNISDVIENMSIPALPETITLKCANALFSPTALARVTNKNTLHTLELYIRESRMETDDFSRGLAHSFLTTLVLTTWDTRGLSSLSALHSLTSLHFPRPYISCPEFIEADAAAVSRIRTL